MNFKNSYIFLERERKNRQPKKKSQKEGKNKIVVTFPPSFKELLKKCFSNIIFFEKEDKFDNFNKGIIKISYKSEKRDVSFKYYNIWSNYYLDIIVNTSSEEDAIAILENINSLLIGKKNIFDKNFVSIVSYDYISEYYCNKLFPLLNEFERRLRKLIFNIYTLNFNLNYYSATTSKKFQNDLKEKTKKDKTIKRENISKEDCYIKFGFYLLDYSDIDTLLFTKTITNEEINKIQKILSENDDLTKLSDTEIRDVFQLCCLKTDWERFFDDKKMEENFQILFNDIRIFRNSIAHCKLIDKNQYERCLKVLEKTSKSLELAIKITEETDFINRNIKLQKESLERLAKTMKKFATELYNPLMPNFESLYRPLNDISEKLKKTANPFSSIFENNFQMDIGLSKFNMLNYFINDDEKQE